MLRLKSALIRWLQRDGVVMFLFGLATIIMTYPLLLRVGGDWVGISDDVFMKLWDIWWLDRVLTTGQDPLNTNHLFYPHGLDLAFHTLSWTTTALGWLLVPVAGSILSAYKITILIGVWSVAYGAYLLILELTQNRTAAWFGGAVCSYAPFLIANSKSHPDVVQISSIPIGALLLIKALRDRSMPAAIGAAVAVGLAAFTSMYILTFATLTLGILFLSMAIEHRRWQDLHFWRITTVFAAGVLVLIGIRLLPWLSNLEEVSGAIDSFYRPAEFQADLMAYITPSSSHSVFGPFVKDMAENFKRSRGHPPYLGFVPLLLMLSALTWKQKRRRVWTWFGIGLFFFLLSLGSVLRVNGRLYENVPLLLPYVDWLPPLRGVRTNFYHVGLLLPLAVCSAFGLLRWVKALEHRRKRQTLFVLSLSMLLLFEYWNGPYPLMEQPINHFYVELGKEPDDLAIVELPMGRIYSKRRLYFQTVHGHPTVEGASGRTPDQAYSYISQNLLLSRWQSGHGLDCDTLSSRDLQEALDQLVRDDIRYAVVQSAPPGDPFASYFTVDPIYRDDELTVFDLVELRGNPPCAVEDVNGTSGSS